MQNAPPCLAVLVPAGIASAGLLALAHPVMAKRVVSDFESLPTSFQLVGRPIGGVKPAEATAPYLAGSRIAAVDNGSIVIDADSGQLIRTDAKGKNIASIAIGQNAGMLAYDPGTKLAYVADRFANRIAIVKIGDQLEVAGSIKTPVEPYGIALSPDRKTVMVTTIADRALVAFDVATTKERWRSALGREPRGLAVSPDGTRAIVAYLETGTVDQIDLLETHSAEHIALSTATTPRRCRHCGNDGDSFARGAFAVAFLGEHEAVVPFQLETPVQIANGGNTGSYGGGFEPPITHQLAFLSLNGERTSQITASIAQHQPRALAWDSAHDALYVAGMGTDSIIQIKNASQVTIAEGLSASLTTGKDRCGPDGVAVTPDEQRPRVVLVHAQRRAGRLRRCEGPARYGHQDERRPDARRVELRREAARGHGAVPLGRAADLPAGRAGMRELPPRWPRGWPVVEDREEHAADAAARGPRRRHAPVQMGWRRRRPADQPDDHDEAARRHRPRQGADRRARRVPRGPAGAPRADARHHRGRTRQEAVRLGRGRLPQLSRRRHVYRPDTSTSSPARRSSTRTPRASSASPRARRISTMAAPRRSKPCCATAAQSTAWSRPQSSATSRSPISRHSSRRSDSSACE